MKTHLKKILLPEIVFSIMLLSCCGSNGNNYQQLVKFGSEIDSTLIKAGPGVSIEVVRQRHGKAISMVYHDGNPVPKVTFMKGSNQWILSKFRFVAVDITNPGAKDLFVEFRMNENDRSDYTQFYGWNAGGQIIPAGETRTVRTYIMRTTEYPSYLDEKFVGMDALPGGIVKAFWWATLPPDSVNYLTIAIMYPPENSKIIISDIRGEGSIDPPAEAELSHNYFPFVDEFGQFKHKEWPGKIHSLEELLNSKEAEAVDLQMHPVPEQWNKYGGWLRGPQLKATGNFRTEKVNGKWWLVDPEGRLFWSHGIGAVEPGGATPISGREHYFTDLPDSVKFKEFYGRSGPNFPKGYYKGKNMIVKTFRGFAWTLYKKYGENWRNVFKERMHARFKSWGMNSIGTGNMEIGITPYCSMLSTGKARRIEASEGAWSKFPDPFDETFTESLMTRISTNRDVVDDPYNIGFFVDNELGWGNDRYIAKAIIQSPEDQPAKKAMLEFLQKKYRSVEVLNKAWQTSYQSWTGFMKSKTLPAAENGDIRIFSAIVADKYFSTIDKTLEKIAPNKLYLGCRFDFHYYPSEDTSCNWSVRIAARYCDVLSFNRYRYSAEDLKAPEADIPVLLTEWHMGAIDRGMLHFSLRYAENQENRAEMYSYYVNSALNNPYCVGSHWFCYVDQPLLGRPDGENLNSGFVDHCDVPYPEMVSAARRIGNSMYDLRYNGK